MQRYEKRRMDKMPYHAFYQPFSSFGDRFPFLIWETVLSTCDETVKLFSICAPERRITGL